MNINVGKPSWDDWWDGWSMKTSKFYQAVHHEAEGLFLRHRKWRWLLHVLSRDLGIILLLAFVNVSFWIFKTTPWFPEIRVRLDSNSKLLAGYGYLSLETKPGQSTGLALMLEISVYCNCHASMCFSFFCLYWSINCGQQDVWRGCI